MNRSAYLILAAVLIGTSATAQINYAAAGIPDSLKKDANVVKRYEEIIFDLKDVERATLTTHVVKTILNADGRDAMTFVEYTNKFISLDDASVTVYDAFGKQIARYRQKDMSTQAMGEGLVEDGKYTYLQLPEQQYPVTIEFESVRKYKGIISYPSYSILVPEEAVQTSRFIARMPESMDLRYQPRNFKIEPEKTSDGKTRQYVWQTQNLAAIYSEPNSVAYFHRYPLVMLAPSKFKIDDYEGDMTSWQNFGRWYTTLTKGIDELPEARRGFYRDLVKGASSDREKIRIIYQYLQKNFRYVSIQLGIGGLKPFPASFTEAKKYGDCKGLSNYMHAALKAVGVKSYMALINRESNGLPVDPSFPCNEFNHAICMAPNNGDTVWLECTSNDLDFGMLDMSTENRYALVVTETGGQLINTPRTLPDENFFSASTTVQLDAEGSGKSQTEIRCKGDYKSELNQAVTAKSDDQKAFLINRLGYKQPDAFSWTKSADTDLQSRFAIQLTMEKVPEFRAGSKMFLSPRLYKIWSYQLPATQNRRLDFFFPMAFQKTDTTKFVLPAGYTVETLPKEKLIQGKNADYHAKYWYDQASNTVYTSATLTLRNHRIPAAEYPDTKKFFDEVLNEEGQRIVIRK